MRIPSQREQMAYATIARLETERDQLKAENDAMRADAERYRWLRIPSGTIVVRNVQCHLSGSRMDDQIDAAMAKDRAK